MGLVSSQNMLPLNIRKVQTTLPNQHLMPIGNDSRPVGEGGFKNEPNYLVDSPSQNDLGSNSQTNTKSTLQRTPSQTMAPANGSGDLKSPNWYQKKPSPRYQSAKSLRTATTIK